MPWVIAFISIRNGARNSPRFRVLILVFYLFGRNPDAFMHILRIFSISRSLLLIVDGIIRFKLRFDLFFICKKFSGVWVGVVRIRNHREVLIFGIIIPIFWIETILTIMFFSFFLLWVGLSLCQSAFALISLLLQLSQILQYLFAVLNMFFCPIFELFWLCLIAITSIKIVVFDRGNTLPMF